MTSNSTKDIENADKMGDFVTNESDSVGCCEHQNPTTSDDNKIIRNSEEIDTPITGRITKPESYDIIANVSNDSEPEFQKITRNPELDKLIYKALKKVKDYFFNNEIEEQKLAEFMFKILTLNINEMNTNNKMAMNTEVLDQLVDQMIESYHNKNEPVTYDIIEHMFGHDTARIICQKLGTEKIDEVVERLLGKDIKKMICDKLESENLDELLNDLIDEKIKFDTDPESKHPNFDEFIEKILGKDTEEFIRKKLENFVKEISVDLQDTANIVELKDTE